MKKILFLTLLIIIILSSCATPVTVEPTPTEAPPFKVIINSNKIISIGPLYIADAEGYFAEQNIEVEIQTFDRSSLSLPLFATGEIDVYNGGLDTGIINIIGSTPDFAVVADKGHFGRGECSYYGMLLRQDLYESGAITRPADLKGETFEGGMSGLSAYFTDTYMKQDGLTLGDVVEMEIPKSAVIEAFTNKSIVTSAQADPFLSQVAATGVASLWLKAEDVLPNFQNAAVVFGPKLIRDNPEVGVRFMVAYLKGVKQYNQGKTDRNVEIIAQYTELPIEDIKNSCWPPIREDGLIDYPSIDDYQNWNIEHGFLDMKVPEEKLWNPYFAEQAVAQLNR